MRATYSGASPALPRSPRQPPQNQVPPTRPCKAGGFWYGPANAGTAQECRANVWSRTGIGITAEIAKYEDYLPERDTAPGGGITGLG